MMGPLTNRDHRLNPRQSPQCARWRRPADRDRTRSSRPRAPFRSGRRGSGVLEIAPDEFDQVAAELSRTLDHFQVPKKEKDEVMAGFFAHKQEVTTGYMAAVPVRR